MIYYQTENIGKSYHYRSGEHENWFMPPHIHEFSELAFTKSGCQVVCVNGKKYYVPENHAILILPNQIHEYMAECPAYVRCAVFSNDFAPLFFYETGNRKMTNPVVDLSEHKQLLQDLEDTECDDKVRLCGLLNLFCYQFLSKCEFSENVVCDNRFAYAVTDYIIQNYRRDITLKEIAERLGYNEKYLSHTLHELTGMNFRTFLSSYRIEYAKQLLFSGELSVMEVALESGFSSLSSFNRIFRQFTGKAPTEYRRLDVEKRKY